MTGAATGGDTNGRGHPELVEGPLRAAVLNGIAKNSRWFDSLTEVLRQAQDDGRFRDTVNVLPGSKLRNPP
jgi:hypothetical protein